MTRESYIETFWEIVDERDLWLSELGPHEFELLLGETWDRADKHSKEDECAEAKSRC